MDPNWVICQLFFSGKGKAELRTKLSILVQEGYLKHTPFLTYLCSLMQDTSNSYASKTSVPTHKEEIVQIRRQTQQKRERLLSIKMKTRT